MKKVTRSTKGSSAKNTSRGEWRRGHENMPRNGGRLHFAPKQCNGRVTVFWDLRRKVRKDLWSYEAESFQVLQRLRGKEKLSQVHTHACRHTHWILLCLPADRCSQLSTNYHTIIPHVYTNSIDLLYTHPPREGTTYLQLISSAFSPLPFPPRPPQQASLWQQCLTYPLSL